MSHETPTFTSHLTLPSSSCPLLRDLLLSLIPSIPIFSTLLSRLFSLHSPLVQSSHASPAHIFQCALQYSTVLSFPKMYHVSFKPCTNLLSRLVGGHIVNVTPTTPALPKDIHGWWNVPGQRSCLTGRLIEVWVR